MVIRITVYVAALFAVYLSVRYPADVVPETLLISLDLIFFVVLAAAVWLSIRYGTVDMFRTTPMDYLVVFIVITLGIFSTHFFNIENLGILTLKSMIMLYACEVIITRLRQPTSRVYYGCLAALAVLSLRGLI